MRQTRTKQRVEEEKKKVKGEGSAKSSTGLREADVMRWQESKDSKKKEKKEREWKRERQRESKRCWCLNSLRGRANPLGSANQLTDCHLPGSVWGR